MASGGLADDVLVGSVNEGDEGSLALEFQRAKLGQRGQCCIAGATTLSQSTFNTCADGLNTSASKVPAEA